MFLFNPVTVVKPTYRLKLSADYLTGPQGLKSDPHCDPTLTDHHIHTYNTSEAEIFDHIEYNTISPGQPVPIRTP